VARTAAAEFDWTQEGVRRDPQVPGEVDRSLRYLKQRFPEAEAWQVSAVGRRDYRTPEGIRVAPALTLLRTLV